MEPSHRAKLPTGSTATRPSQRSRSSRPTCSARRKRTASWARRRSQPWRRSRSKPSPLPPSRQQGGKYCHRQTKDARRGIIPPGVFFRSQRNSISTATAFSTKWRTSSRAFFVFAPFGGGHGTRTRGAVTPYSLSRRAP